MGEFDEPGVRARKLSLLSAAASLAGAFSVSLAASPAGGQTPPPTQADFEQEIRKRDAVIEDLMRRVEALERNAAAGSGAGAAPGNQPTASAPAPPTSNNASAAVAGSMPASSVQTAQAPGPEAAAAGPPPAAPVQTAQASATAPSAPGQFEVDEDAVDRALERTLVRTGALLLPAGSVEVQPSYLYSYLETDTPVFVSVDGEQLVGRELVRKDLTQFELAVSVGLPWDAQLDLEVPYRIEDETRVVSVNFRDFQERGTNGDGFGDIGVALSKAFTREEGRMPKLIGAVSWDSTSGERDGGLAFGSEFNELRFSLTAVKRADPLVWVGTLAWQETLEDGDVDPGDEWSVGVGAVLAVSPTTSLRFNLDQAFAERTKIRGVALPGSDDTRSVLSLGASSVLSPRVLLDVRAGVGLTDAAADYYVTVALPIRFDSLF